MYDTQSHHPKQQGIQLEICVFIYSMSGPPTQPFCAGYITTVKSQSDEFCLVKKHFMSCFCHVWVLWSKHFWQTVDPGGVHTNFPHRLSYWINKLLLSKFNSLCATGFEFVRYSVGIEFCPSFFFFFFFLAVQICCIFHFAQLCFAVGLSFRPSFQLTSNLLYILWDEWIYIRARDTVWFHFSFFWFQWKEKWVLGINTGLYSIFSSDLQKVLFR